MFALNHTSVFHLHRRKCASRSAPLRNGRSVAMHMLSSLAILLIFSANKNNGRSAVLCDGAAVAGSMVLPPTPLSAVYLSRSVRGRSVSGVSAGSDRGGGNNIGDRNSGVAATAAALLATSMTSQIVNLTRQHGGDVFDAMDNSRCDMDTCVGLSSGTAGLYKMGNKESEMANRNYKVNNDECRCQCLPHLDTFREDLNICVDDIHECTLAPFVSGSTSEKIPFVFLPLHGQIIHPSKEINFQGVKSPVCAVSGAQYLTPIGWTELRNPIDSDVPFRLYRDEGRTFLQWQGEPDLRFQMQGRLVLVHLMCRDMAPITRESLLTVDNGAGHRAIKPKKVIQNLFSPCVAFRVVGTPMKLTNNVTEVSFQSEATLSSIVSAEGLTAKEYILIAVCSLILGLIYVASVFLYIHVKRYKSRITEIGPDAPNDGGNTTGKPSEYGQNDQVKYGTGFSRSGNYNRSISSSNGMGERRMNGSARKMSLTGLVNEEQGVVKSNPLLKHFPNLSDNSGFTSDMSNSNSECDDERAISHEIISKNMQSVSQSNSSKRNENSPNGGQETECLPEANVSIIEDMTTEDKLENMKAIVNGTMRRKLYFNPAYFEPHLLMSPPPAAIEFLSKIREVITMAKYKMAAKRFQPSLIVIHEERATNGIEAHNHQQESTATASISNVKVEDGRSKKSCAGCPGCCDKNGANASTSNCKNCGDKRNSIRKWLEGVSKHENENDILSESDDHSIRGKTDTEDGDSCKRGDTSKTNDSSSSSDTDTVKANSLGSKSSKKRQAPPIPTVGPKVIAHSSKHAIVKNEIKKPKTAPPAPPSHAPYDVVAAEIYNNLSITGNEIYNNPQFMLSSPPLSQRSRTSRHSHNTNRSFKKHIEVMDQYANPMQLRQTEAEAKKAQRMPDMVYEAVSKDFNSSTGKRSNIDQRAQEIYSDISLPTPDYDDPSNSTYSRKRNNSYANEDALIPPPDYNNTLGRRQYQPDSPIYHRKSPHYLIVDYETDSLERTNTNRTNRNIMTPHSNNSSDLSSHPSPSLSSALPLEEEVEVRHTVYDRVEGYRKDGDPVKTINVVPKTQSIKPSSIYEDISNVPNAYLMSRRSSLTKEPIIKYNTPFQGSMTIEVDHEPTDDELSTESDQFEPDTLDRKPKKMNNATKPIVDRFQDIPNNQRNVKAWTNENLNSLPDINCVQRNNVTEKVQSQVILRSSGSFKSNSLGTYLSDVNAVDRDANADGNFCSLREIYAAKNQKNLLQRPSFTEHDKKDGRMLTLEARHSKRQRQTTLEKNIKKQLPPDIIPNGKNVLMNVAKFESNKNNEKMIQKNLMGWSTDDVKMQKKKRNDVSDEPMVSETMSNSSERTDITGVSDNHANSESNSVKRAYAQVCKQSAGKLSAAAAPSKPSNNHMANGKGGDPNLYMNLSDLRCMKTDQSDCNSDSSTLKTGSTKFYYKSNLNQAPPPPPPTTNGHHGKTPINADDLDRIEILSSKSLKLDMDLPRIVDTSAKDLITELANDTSSFAPMGSVHPTKVFHVDVSSTSPTNGMQIALGIRDRVKKSKDLKNAWKKFVNLAASKFPGTSSSPSPTSPKSPGSKGEFDLMTDAVDRDDGISSMHTFDDTATISSSGDTKSSSIEILSRSPSSSSSSDIATQRPNKNEMDYGYISADSNESRAQQKKLYERFNFKANKNALTEAGTSKSALGEIDCFAHKMPVNRMQDIKENAEHDRHSNGSLKCTKQPTRCAPKPFDVPKMKLNDYVPKNSTPMVPATDAINVRIYSSSDDDRYSSGMSSESDENADNDLDDLCESGAESEETHSVLFKNIRKTRDKP